MRLFLKTRKLHQQQISELAKRRSKAQAKLKKVKRRAKQAKALRRKRKVTLERAGEIDPSLLPRKKPGRARLTSEQSELFLAIIDVATTNQTKLAADPRRRSEQIKSYMRLDDLVKNLWKEGFKISRTATYMKLLPRCESSIIEGRRHVETAPVRFARRQITIMTSTWMPTSASH